MKIIKTVVTFLFLAIALLYAAVDLRAQPTLEDRIAQIEAELKALKEEARLQEQAAEHRAMSQVIDKVIEDAKYRQTTSGLFAGYDEKHFFLRSLVEDEQGKSEEQFRLNINGHFQFRHIVNHQNGRVDETDSGFQARRAKMGINGHVHTPMDSDGGPQKISYGMILGTSSMTGNISLISYAVGLPDIFGSGIEVIMGRTRIPFLHAEKVSSRRQLAVERASVSEFFTVDKSEQIKFSAGDSLYGKPWHTTFSIHDGASTEMSEFNRDPVEFGMAARGEIALLGSLKPYSDYANIRGKSVNPNFVIGAAWVYQLGDPDNGNGVSGSPPAAPPAGSGEGQTDADADYFAWTLDAGYEQGPFGIFASVMGGHTYSRYDAQSGTNREMYGVLAQSRYNLSHLIDRDIEPFIRYEWINDGMAATENAQLLTIGANWYHWGHNAKLTSDVVWFFDGDIPVANPFGAGAFGRGLGMSGIISANTGQAVVFRTQYQLFF